MSRWARLVAAALLLLAVPLVITLTAGAASAHAARVSTDPAEHAAVSTAPAQVSATFNEDLQTTFAAMTVVGPDGNLWTADSRRYTARSSALACGHLGRPAITRSTIG